MGKTKETLRGFLSRMVQEFPGTFRTDKSVLYCLHCGISVSADKISHVKQHIATEKHKKKLKRAIKVVHRLAKVY